MANEVKVGIVVVGAMIIFVIVFLSVATMEFGGGRVEYYAYFKFAGGLDSGTLVRYGGRKAGVISDVHPSPEDPTTTEVVFQVRSEVPINEQSKLRRARSGLGGTATARRRQLLAGGVRRSRA